MLSEPNNHEDSIQSSSSSSQRQTPNELHLVTKDGKQCFVWRSNQLTYIAQNRKELPLVLANKFGHLATKLDLSYNNLSSFKSINLFTNLNELILDNNCLQDDELDFRQNLRLKTLSLNKNKLCDLSKLIISIKVCFPNLEFLSLIGNPFCPIQILPAGGGSLVRDTNQVPNFNSSRPPSRCDTERACSSSSTAAAAAAATSPQHFTGSYSSFKDPSYRQETRNNPPDLRVDSSEALVVARAHDDDDHDVDADQERVTYLANQEYRYFIINHLPNLHFLDSSPIGSQERDAALNSCFWIENLIANNGRTSCIIWGQTMPNNGLLTQSGALYSDNVESTDPNSHQLTARVLPDQGMQVAIYQRGGLQEEQQQQQVATKANGERRTLKGQFSQQVKCQMVGGFAFARTLLWAFISLTSTNLAHCSGTLLALSLKGIGASGRSSSNMKDRQIDKRHRREG